RGVDQPLRVLVRGAGRKHEHLFGAGDVEQTPVEIAAFAPLAAADERERAAHDASIRAGATVRSAAPSTKRRAGNHAVTVMRSQTRGLSPASRRIVEMS